MSDRLAASVLSQARQRGLTMATAESCTGGLIAARLTSIAGSSDVFGFGFVTYANEAKSQLLGVPETLLAAFGAVSLETAEAMARGAKDRSGAALAVSVTGIAGPGGAVPGKPVGTVCFALAKPDGAVLTSRQHFSGDRESVRKASADFALSWLLEATKA